MDSALAEPPPPERVVVLREAARAEVSAGRETACVRLEEALATRLEGELVVCCLHNVARAQALLALLPQGGWQAGVGTVLTTSWSRAQYLSRNRIRTRGGAWVLTRAGIGDAWRNAPIRSP